jgi:hypothetical protein
VGKEKATMMLALPCDLPCVPHVPCRKRIVDMSGSWRISEATVKPNDQVRLVVTLKLTSSGFNGGQSRKGLASSTHAGGILLSILRLRLAVIREGHGPPSTASGSLNAHYSRHQGSFEQIRSYDSRPKRYPAEYLI